MSTRGREGGPVRFGHGELMPTSMVGTHGADACSGAVEVVVVQRAMALASRTYGEDKPTEREVGEAMVGASHERASLSSVVHHDHGSDGGGAMWPHLSSDGGASCWGRWSQSWQSYVRDESNGGAAVVVCLASEGTIAMLLLLCSTLERRTSERDRERERERE